MSRGNATSIEGNLVVTIDDADDSPVPSTQAMSLDRTNPRSRQHEDVTAGGVRHWWACVPLTDAVQAVAEAEQERPLDWTDPSVLKAAQTMVAMWRTLGKIPPGVMRDLAQAVDREAATPLSRARKP